MATSATDTSFGACRWTISAFARIENHYFVNGGWMRDGQLLEKQAIDKIRHIPTVVAQGRVRPLSLFVPPIFPS